MAGPWLEALGRVWRSRIDWEGGMFGSTDSRFGRLCGASWKPAGRVGRELMGQDLDEGAVESALMEAVKGLMTGEKKEEVTRETSFAEMGFDSLASASLASALSRAAGVKIAPTIVL